MQIQSLSLTNFRAFRRLEMEFVNHLTLLHGKNAQGKTSILEAIHFLSILTSPIAGYDRELVNFLCLNDEQPVARMIAAIDKNGKTQRIEVRLILDASKNGSTRMRKEVIIDGVKRRLFDAVGFFNSVIFLPQMTRIIEDGPDERRRYLDQTLSQAYPGYMKALSKYQQGNVKRNALLKQLAENGGDQDQLTFWDQLISEHGAILMRARGQAVLQLEAVAREKHAALTMGKETLMLIYQPAFDQWMGASNQIPSIEAIQQAFLEALRQVRREEIRRGVTTIGPHRDELIFSVNGINLGLFGSRGQIRTSVMSLKLAEMDWLKEKTGQLPVLLLDETLAELDLDRRGDLLKTLKNGSQVILTTADLELFPDDFIQRCVTLEIVDGAIR